MNMTVYLQFSSLIYFIFLLAVFFIKKRVNNIETKFYGIFLVVNFIGLVVDISLAIASIKLSTASVIYAIIAKTYLVYFVTWVALLCGYMYIVSRKKKTYMIILNIRNWIKVL